jgi:hypothetical protein
MKPASLDSLLAKKIPCSCGKFPCSMQKIPCSTHLREFASNMLKSRKKITVFARAEGICRKGFEMTGEIDAVRPQKPRIRKNSLLNSLF